MSRLRETDDLAGRILRAAEWKMRLDERDGSAELEAEFEDWRGDVANAEAWTRLMGPLELIAQNANEPKMIGYRQSALKDARSTSAALNRPQVRWRAGLAAAAVLIAVAGLGYYFTERPDDYATAFGERRVVTLADGSKVSLDSDSEMTVRYTPTSRELHLLKGQARFDVAHDVEKPFSVVARNQKVIATGTAFNIDMTQPKVLVTLIEGHVVVLDQNAVAQPQSHLQTTPRRAAIELHAGQQLAALPAAAPTVAPTDVQQVVAWTGGQLLFDDQPLSEVVARINHYTDTPITVADSKVGALRISGSFNTGDVAGFLDIVQHYLPVREQVDPSGRVTLLKK